MKIIVVHVVIYCIIVLLVSVSYSYNYSYLACRCQFLEESVFLRFYKGSTDEVKTGTIWNFFKSASSLMQQDEYCDQKKLRSLLLKLMKEEVREICIPLKGALAGFCPPHLQVNNNKL